MSNRWRPGRWAWSAFPADDDAVPDMIPEDLPDEVMLVLVMVAPAAVNPAAGDDLPAGLELGGALQMRLNCSLPAAITGLRSALAALEDSMRQAVEEHANRN